MTIDKGNYDYRIALAQELSELIILLKKYALKFDIEDKSIGAIGRAIKRLREAKDLPPYMDEDGKDVTTPCCWGYSVQDFILKINTSSNIQYPKTLKEAMLNFSVDIIGEYEPDDTKVVDPFKHLEFNIVIEGYSRGKKKHIMSYHLDRHIKPPKGKEDNEAHPIYHFQFGGHKLKPYSLTNFGSSIIMDNPRVIHYPMDFIIGFDFVISNFTPALWKALKRENAYIRMMKNAQTRTIKPFISSLAHHFNFHAPNNHWRTSEICPQIH